MFASYAILFNPDKIGGSIIFRTSYLRNFFMGLLLVIFEVVTIKLKGTELTMLELTIVGSVAMIATLLVPLLSNLEIKTLLNLTLIIELYMIVITILLIQENMTEIEFIYHSTFQEFLITLVWSNLSAKQARYYQKKTLSETAEHRTKGNIVVSALGSSIGVVLCSVLGLTTDDLDAFLVLFAIANICFLGVLFFTNIKIMEYCFNDIKYPAINK